MTKNVAVFFALAAVVVGAAVSLGTGASYLDARLPGGLPVGTLLALLGLNAGVGVSLLLSRPGTPLRWLAVVSLVAALAWFPIGYALAGNAALTFNDGADGTLFLQRFTPGVVLFIVGTMALVLGSAAFRGWRERRTRSAQAES